MEDRIQEELDLLRRLYPDLEYLPNGNEHWFRLPGYMAPDPWSPSEIDIVFHVTMGYPGAKPYGFFVPMELQHNGRAPDSRKAPCQPPFGGNWRFLSWDAPNWNPKNCVQKGDNLECWVRGFRKRFQEGP